MSKLLEARFGKFDGLRNTIEVEDFGPSDLNRATNVDLDDAKMASRRDGLLPRVAGAAHSIWSEDGICLFIQAGELKQLRSDRTTADTLAAGLSALPMVYQPMNGRVYHTNGSVTGVLDEGRVRGWGIRIPDTPQATAELGQMIAGTYLYAMTRLIGLRESGAGLAERIDLGDNGAIRFDWTPVSGRVALYITEPNGEVLRRAVVVDGAQGTFTWRGGTPAVTLSTQFLDPPPAGQALGEHNGRILIGAGPNVFATAPQSPEHCRLKDFLGVDGSTVQFNKGVSGGIYVGTEKQVVFLAGGRLQETSMRTVVAARSIYGSALLADIVQVTGKGQAGEKVLLFKTAMGIHLGFPDGTVQNLTRDRYAFSPPAAVAAVLRTDPKLTQYIVSG